MPTNGADQPEPEHPTPSEREHTNLRLTKLEVDVAHAVSKAYLEKAIGDMKEGIAQAVGKMETTIAKERGDMKVEIATTIGQMKVGISEIKWSIVKWVLGGMVTIISIGLTVYKLFIFKPPISP